MSRLSELVEREIVVANCLASSLRARCLAWHAAHDAPPSLTEPASVWLGRAESSLLFAQAELAYLLGPAVEPEPAFRRIA